MFKEGFFLSAVFLTVLDCSYCVQTSVNIQDEINHMEVTEVLLLRVAQSIYMT